MIKSSILKLAEGKNLTENEAGFTADSIMRGDATPSQIGAILMGLRIKGETIDEITGFAKSMREHSLHIKPTNPNLVDTCGTGGDLSHTFNISTVSALVAAGAGVSIAKHGNRSVSSKSGSADLLESLGVKIDIDPKKVEKCINEIGIGFMFAPSFHPAMKFAGVTRREIGVRTIFNILGPLTNPAGAGLQILGVYSEALCEKMAEVLKKLGTRHALIVHGMDGMDELSISSETKISKLKEGNIKNYSIKPEDFGLVRAPKESIKVQNIEESRVVSVEILEKHEDGPKMDVILLNAAAAIYISGLAKDIKEGIIKAKESIRSNSALNKLKQLVKLSNE